MSTVSTTMKPVQSLVRLLALFAAFVWSILFVSLARADDVLIFYNNDPKVAISRHDGALVTHNSKLLAEYIKRINPELNVRLEPVEDIQSALQLLHDAKERIRGVVFVGHGNQQVYALNRRNHINGRQLADLIAYLPEEKMSDRFTVYFLGCEMAKEQNGKTNFLKEFTNRLTTRVSEARRAGIDVIAHTSMSAYKSFKDPSLVQSLAYKSGLGSWAESVTINKGSVWPNLVALASTNGIAALAGLDHSSLMQVGAASLAAVFAKAYVEAGISKYGTQLTHKTEVKQSISTLLRTSFQADQCRAIFKLKSL